MTDIHENATDASSSATATATAPDPVGVLVPLLTIPTTLDEPEPLPAYEKLYLPELFKGLWNSFRHMFKRKYTVAYPFKKYDQKVRDNRFRGQHRLKKKTFVLADGTTEERENCVACMMCSTACPAECIYIEAEPAPSHWWNEHSWGVSGREKRPRVFTIDMLRCIYCGMCEEACPCDAIELTPKPYKVESNRADFIYDKDKLLNN